MSTNRDRRDVSRHATMDEDEATDMRNDEIQAEQNKGMRQHLGKAAPERRSAQELERAGVSSTMVHGGNHGYRADERDPGSVWRGS